MDTVTVLRQENLDVDGESTGYGDIEIDWKKPPSLLDFKEDYTQALPIHTAQCEKIQKWLDNLNIEGDAKPAKRQGRSRVQPRLIRRQAEWRYSALSEPFLNSEDMYEGQPNSWEDVKAAEQNAMILNYQFNSKINKNQLIDEFVRTAVNEGTVILRVGWEFSEEEKQVREPEVELVPTSDTEYLQLLDEVAQLRLSNRNEYERTVPPELKLALDKFLETKTVYQGIFKGWKTVTKKVIVKNHPTIDVCHYDNVVIDPTCNGDLSKANFVIYNYESSRAELEKQNKYKNLNKITPDTSPSGYHNYSDNAIESGNFKFKDLARQKFTVHEYWGFSDVDGTGTTKPITISWVGNTIIHADDNPYPDQQLPFVSAVYLPVKDSVYGEPDGALLIENQQIMGAVTRGIVDLLGRSANGQTGTRAGFLDPVNKRKYEAGNNYEFTGQFSPAEAIYEHQYPQIPSSAEFMLNLQNAEAESLTGVKSFSGGLSGEAFGEVAAGIRGVLDSAGKRELAILRRLAKCMIDVGKKIVAMNGEFLSEEEIIRVTNEEFLAVRRDELAGEFDLKLAVSTAEADNAKSEKLSFMLQTLGNVLGPEFVSMIMGKIAKLENMPDLEKQLKDYKPEPDPIEQAFKEAEIQKIYAEIEHLKGQAVEKQAEAALDTIKQETEKAKVDLMEAQINKSALDFVEQESGVTQERELQQQGEQARANMELARVKHGLAKQEKNEDKEKELQSNLLREYIRSSSSNALPNELRNINNNN